MSACHAMRSTRPGRQQSRADWRVFINTQSLQPTSRRTLQPRAPATTTTYDGGERARERLPLRRSWTSVYAIIVVVLCWVLAISITPSSSSRPRRPDVLHVHDRTPAASAAVAVIEFCRISRVLGVI